MKTFRLILLLMSFLIAEIVAAQETFPRNDVKDVRADAYAFIHATLVVDFQTTLQDATLIIRGGKIEQAGINITVPAGYATIDLSGKYIYPSLIDMYTTYGLPEVDRVVRGGNPYGSTEQIEPQSKGPLNANQSIRAHYNASEEFTVNSKTAEELRKFGFGTVLTFKPDGLARGTSALVTLSEETANKVVINSKSAAHYSFSRGSSSQFYPRSMMGYTALLRQTYLDAAWFGAQNPRPFVDQSLEGWIQSQRLPQIFETSGWLDLLRADKLGDEFNTQYIIKGGGDEYKRISEVKASHAPLIIPVNFPDAFDVDDPLDADRISLADMKHWELAPTNPATLEKNGITFALTTFGLKKTGEFMVNLRKAIENGLSEEGALKALTLTPARLLHAEDKIGSLRKGLLANFIITSGKIFDPKTIVFQNWVQGKPFSVKSLETRDESGKYKLTVGDQSWQLDLTEEKGVAKGKIKINDTTSVDVELKQSNELITIGFKPSKQAQGVIRLSGYRQEKGWKGKGQLADGTWINWQAYWAGDADKKSSKTDVPKKEELGKLIYPFVAHGAASLPATETLLIKNATVWTNESEGILQATDVLLKDGKIQKIGKDLSDNSARIVDGTGKHLTAGIIDEHSHIAGGGNDVASNSSMVRIEDQLEPEDINIYRALSGGVVAVQVLHGSADAIGGQSALIKLRWGENAENLKIQGADAFIKFALGENVKRTSNPSSIRFPQTRMGVEQVYVDAFSSARDYEKAWTTWNALSAQQKSTAIKPRRDLAEETILEILNKKRFITCHSYVQSEINMLMKVAEQFNFRINTFTHILEGYKVADKMKQHGAAASTFSDWWNYKWEVRYAIPYNASIMNREGVVTAINSDDANMGRRLNQEAGKSVKYGGMSEEDALKMVTLNPARMLHLDKQMGSLQVGKSADVVLWTGHPLSVYSKAEKTIIDGKIYFDLEQDQVRNKEINAERARLIQKMKNTKKAGAASQKVASPQQQEFHCEDENQ